MNYLQKNKNVAYNGARNTAKEMMLPVKKTAKRQIFISTLSIYGLYQNLFIEKHPYLNEFPYSLLHEI